MQHKKILLKFWNISCMFKLLTKWIFQAKKSSSSPGNRSQFKLKFLFFNEIYCFLRICPFISVHITCIVINKLRMKILFLNEYCIYEGGLAGGNKRVLLCLSNINYIYKLKQHTENSFICVLRLHEYCKKGEFTEQKHSESSLQNKNFSWCSGA